MAGSFFLTVVCVEGLEGLRGPCPAGFVQSIENVFAIPAAEASAIQTFFQPFDAAISAGFFMSAMTTTIGIWFVSWAIGNVVQAFRRF